MGGTPVRGEAQFLDEWERSVSPTTTPPGMSRRSKSVGVMPANSSNSRLRCGWSAYSASWPRRPSAPTSSGSARGRAGSGSAKLLSWAAARPVVRSRRAGSGGCTAQPPASRRGRPVADRRPKPAPRPGPAEDPQTSDAAGTPRACHSARPGPMTRAPRDELSPQPPNTAASRTHAPASSHSGTPVSR
jgi:hypothetical protein